MRSAEAGCYAPFSIGVMDRAAIHVGEVGQQLADFAWNYRSPHHNYQPLRMNLQPLPTRFFELNPQELVFAFATNKMKTYDASTLPFDETAVRVAAIRAFKECTKEHVMRYFKHGGYRRS